MTTCQSCDQQRTAINRTDVNHRKHKHSKLYRCEHTDSSDSYCEMENVVEIELLPQINKSKGKLLSTEKDQQKKHVGASLCKSMFGIVLSATAPTSRANGKVEVKNEAKDILYIKSIVKGSIAAEHRNINVGKACRL